LRYTIAVNINTIFSFFKWKKEVKKHKPPALQAKRYARVGWGLLVKKTNGVVQRGQAPIDWQV